MMCRCFRHVKVYSPKNKLKQVVHTLAHFCPDVAENLLPLQEEGATTC